jgi:hypothetical protein
MIQVSKTVQFWQQLHQSIGEPQNAPEYAELETFS